MLIRRALIIMSTTFVVAACSDQPVSPDGQLAPSEAQLAHTPTHTGLLSDIAVTQTLAGGATLEGTLSIENLTLQDGQLLAAGNLTGTVTDALGNVTNFTQNFTDIVLGLTGDGNGASCDILNLDLGPLFLDLLGLQVDLSAISLDITAVQGPGNLLGNLLCAVAGLLDGNGPVAGLQNLLNQINNLLG